LSHVKPSAADPLSRHPSLPFRVPEHRELVGRPRDRADEDIRRQLAGC